MPVANQLEAALVSILEDADFVNVNTGQSDELLDSADIVCAATTGDETPRNSGNYSVHCVVSRRTPADKENDGTSHLSAHESAFDSIREALDTDELAANLIAAGVGHVFWIGGRSVHSGQEGRLWVSRWEFDCVACESDLT
jgi:hypothetical protein